MPNTQKSRKARRKAQGNLSTIQPMRVTGSDQRMGVTAPLTPDPFPSRWRGTLTLVLVGFLGTNGTGGVTTALKFGDALSFNLNSLYDTALTTSSRQPQYFSTLATLYKRYKVHKTKLDLLVMNNYGSPVMFGWRIEPPGGGSTIDNTDVQSGMTLPYTTVIPLSAQGGQSVVRVQKVIDMAQICGVTKLEYDSNTEDYAALVTANPARMPTLEIALANAINTNSDVISYTATFSFDSEMFDRIL